MFESTPASPLHSPADSLSARSPRLRRCRTSSSLYSTAPKISLALPTKTEPSIFVTVRTGNHGAFAPTADAHSSLQLFVRPKSRKSLPPPVPSLDIPQISRTASSIGSPVVLGEFDRGYTPYKPPAPSNDRSSTPPLLASVERRSRLCSNQVHCATCGVLGSNFPSCSHCGQAWCSRACRLPGGRKHTCPFGITIGSRTPGKSIPPIAIDSVSSHPICIPSTPIPQRHF